MSGSSEFPRAIAQAMLAMVDPADVALSGDRDRLAITIAGATITFGDAQPHAFERLASAIEAQIAYQRAGAMVAAAGETGTPLWLVAGSDMLGKWLAWSRVDKPLAKGLSLTGRADAAPVVGDLARRSRRELGQMSAKIRVRSGQAVAERIELSHHVPAIAILGDRALIRIARHHLPEMILSALLKNPTSNDRWRASEIVDHPFFTTHDFMVARVDNDRDEVVVELETAWAPLAPIPEAAWAAVPRGADPAFPWRATGREVVDLYGLAGRGERALQERL
ncbi:hypothetical protein JW805_03120 [Roseomonas aeriglobus]|nr:hypothetical protein [Roseomonas aeriglobus]